MDIIFRSHGDEYFILVNKIETWDWVTRPVDVGCERPRWKTRGYTAN